jgi:uncharacterized protein YjcR
MRNRPGEPILTLRQVRFILDCFDYDRSQRPHMQKVTRGLRQRLADKFGVSTRTINSITGRERWKHVKFNHRLKRKLKRKSQAKGENHDNRSPDAASPEA